ncbi:MAG: ribbon-helix-helix domain-containing protein [candidate division WOR-3 bacterium]
MQSLSIRLDEATTKKLERIIQTKIFTNKSEFVRAAIRDFLLTEYEKNKIERPKEQCYQ